MALIKAYENKPQQITPMVKERGFDAKSGKSTPFDEFTEVHEILDAITAAVEAGTIDTDNWVSQIFATTEVFDEFLEQYQGYEECFRTYDRWYWALFRIADNGDEEGFVTSQEIADRLREVAEETGQIERD